MTYLFSNEGEEFRPARFAHDCVPADGKRTVFNINDEMRNRR